MTDAQTNVVYVSDLLAPRHPSVYEELRHSLTGSLRVIGGTKDIWCRDYMPVQIACDRFVQFRYAPDYLQCQPELITPDAAALVDFRQCARSELVVDGGNIVRFGNAAIICEKMYRENSAVERPKLRGRLRDLLEVERLIVIPKEPYDAIGHADGLVRFVDEQTLLVSDFATHDGAFAKRLSQALRGFELIKVPYVPTGDRFHGIDSAEGVYINFMQVGNRVFVPTYGQPADDVAMRVFQRAFSSSMIIPVASREIARGGGVINCVTWNIRDSEESTRGTCRSS